MIFKKSWPVRGLKMKMAPLMGLVVKLPGSGGGSWEGKMSQRPNSQPTFKCFVDCDTVDVCVINKPNDLIAEKFSVVLTVEVRLRRLTGVELEACGDG